MGERSNRGKKTERQNNIALKALRPEPQRRYESVEQFSEDPRRYLEGLPVVARKDTLGYFVPLRFSRRG